MRMAFVTSRLQMSAVRPKTVRSGGLPLQPPRVPCGSTPAQEVDAKPQGEIAHDYATK